MQCHNYISDVYNKPNRLKIGWKLSKLLFKKYMYHYQHNVMGERADCGKMAAMCGRSTPLAGNADETSRAVSTTAHLCTSCTYFECLVCLHCQIQQNWVH